MRVATSSIYDVNVAALNQQQARLLQTQQQVSSGRRMLTPADDPAAAALALNVTQADAANTQFISNIEMAQNSLALSEGVLQGVTTLLQDVRSIAVNAGNAATLSNSDRKMLASDLQGRLDDLIVLSNHTDANGSYLFSGYQGNTTPFVMTAGGVQYLGDDGQRMVQVSTAGQVATGDSGANIFMRIKDGNGTFAIQPAVANTGSGIASVGAALNPALLTGNSYQISFGVAGGVTTYSVTNTTTATVISAGNPYVSGQSIAFDGMQFDISGAPANGDKFNVVPSTTESVFKTLSDLINTLNGGIIAGNVASATQYTANINRALNGMERSLDNVLVVRASIGSRLRQLDAEKTTVTDIGLQYQQVLSQLQDVDYNKAISDLTRQKTTLEAAQKSFMQVQNLSLFNYM